LTFSLPYEIIDTSSREDKVKQQIEDAAAAVMIFVFMYFAWTFAYIMEPM